MSSDEEREEAAASAGEAGPVTGVDEVPASAGDVSSDDEASASTPPTTDEAADEADDDIPAWMKLDLRGGPRRARPVLLAAKHGYLWMRHARRRRPVAYALAQVFITVSLTAAAMGVHWWLNVPERIIESPHDQGAKAKKGRSKPRSRRPRARSPSAHTDRSLPELQREQQRFAGTAFEDEPARPVWARRHQALINRAVVVARRHAFEGAPEQPRVVLSDTECRTVRCRFELRSQYGHAVDAVGETLSRLQSSGEDVWHTYERVALPAPEGQQEHYLQVTVMFQTDSTDSRALSIRPSAEAEADTEPQAAADGRSGA